MTTPLCLLQGRAHAEAVTALPLPAPALSRELTLVTRRGEFPVLAPRVAAVARGLIQERIMPECLRLAPWLAAEGDRLVATPPPGPQPRTPRGRAARHKPR